MEGQEGGREGRERKGEGKRREGGREGIKRASTSLESPLFRHLPVPISSIVFIFSDFTLILMVFVNKTLFKTCLTNNYYMHSVPLSASAQCSVPVLCNIYIKRQLPQVLYIRELV